MLRSTGLVKYFMRNINFGLETQMTLHDVVLLQEMQERELGIERKHVLYRKLFFRTCPVQTRGASSGF